MTTAERTTNQQSGTTIAEVAQGIYRINTPANFEFSFNQYLVLDDEPLLFHTGPRRMFPLVREALETITSVERLRYVAFSHVESDECGSLNEWLAAAPQAVPVCSQTAAIVSIGDMADRAPKAMADGETLRLGQHEVIWLDAPQLPHAWECGYMFESTTRTLLCGDLFTQPGSKTPALTGGDILTNSEEFRKAMNYYSYTVHARALFDKLIATNPRMLACMHGSAWEGDGAKMLGELAEVWVQLGQR